MRKYKFIERLSPRPRYIRQALGYFASLLVLLFTKTKREGSCNIPKAGPFIIAINHFSYIDPLFVISTIQRISKPGRRIFSSAQSLPKINNGLGIAIISTPKGVMTDIEARKQKLGGEIICKVF